MFIRILPPIFYGIIITLIVLLITVGMISSIVGLKALKSSFKMISLFSFGNFSIWHTILIMALSEMIGVIALSTLMGYISLKTKETPKSIILGVSLSVLYMIGSKVASSSTSNINGLFNLIPMGSSQTFNAISGFSFHFGIWEPYIIVMGSLAVLIVSSGALIITINKN